MTDAEYEVQKARIQALSDKWLTPLGLRWWRTEMAYYREGLPEDMKRERGTSVAATTKADWKYLDALISFDLMLTKDIDDEHLEWLFIHEMMHVLLHEMRWQEHENADNLDHEERVATMLAKAFVWTYEAGQESVKVAEPVNEPAVEAPKMNGQLDPATQTYLEATRMG